MRCSIGDHVADVVAATAAVFMLAITVLGFAGCDSPREKAVLAEDHATNAAQITRLRRHFAAVDAELRTADVSHLTPAQREAREASLARLRAYAARGEFPHNHLRGELTPVFIDEHGTRCAMAHLIEQGGGAELARAIAHEENLAYVPQLAADARFQPDLVAWLDRNGLTAAEAARIQPSYNGCDFNPCDDKDKVDRGAAIASVGLAALNGLAIGANLRDDAGNGAGGGGLLAGGLLMFAGYAMQNDLDPQRELQQDLAWMDMGLGAITVALSIRTLTRDRAPAAVAPPPSSPGGWSIAPVLGSTRGVSLSTRF
ncbi:MAG TPA: hypothetical protein VM261_22420 [Kofleriaceae bacterium]|nr:hypothetical protein [Kofleriaceae bacterium]